MSDRDADLVAPTWATVRALRDRIEELEELLAQAHDVRGAAAAEDAAQTEVFRRAVGLQPRPASIALYLYRARGRCCDRLDIEEHFDMRSAKLLDIHILKIRRALGEQAVMTIYGRGYALSAEGIAAVEAALQRKQERAA